MKPYYEDESVTIYHADCRELLPELKADLVLTDPPYGIGEAAGKNKSRGRLVVSQDYGDAPWDDLPIGEDLLAQVLAAAPHQIIFGGNYYDLPSTSCWLIWDKDNGKTDFADAEMAWTNFPTAVRLIKWRWQGMLQELGGKDKERRVHPTQKPLAVIRWCIQRAPDEPQPILDPFMGSGTTLRAAKDLKRKAIGIEIEERYCEIAAQRMSQLAMQL